MANLFGRRFLAGIFMSEGPKSPWGSGSGGNGNGNGGAGGPGEGGGPRNPWAFPPEGRRGRPGPAGTLDELLKRTRRGGGGGGGGGAGFPGGIPGMPQGNTLWWLIAGGILLLWVLFTSVHAIGPQQRGVVSVLGSYSRTIGPGIQLTLPAPFATVEKVDLNQIRQVNFPQSGENLMLTGDQNIVDLKYQVRWDVADAERFVFQIKEPEETVQTTAESAMRAIVATATLNQTIGSGRTDIELRVRDLMQQILDEYGAGVRVQGVEIKEAAAPQQVDEDFKRVSAAQQEAEGNINKARAYAQQVIAGAQGETVQFDRLYEQYRQAPEVTRRRMYYETMEKVLSKNGKTILDTRGTNTILPLNQLPGGVVAAPDAARPQAQGSSPASGQTQPKAGGGTR